MVFWFRLVVIVFSPLDFFVQLHLCCWQRMGTDQPVAGGAIPNVLEVGDLFGVH
jgi:hypothetical protein